MSDVVDDAERQLLERRIAYRRRIAANLLTEAERLEAEATELRTRAARTAASADQLEAELDRAEARRGGPVDLCPVSEAPGQPRTHRAGCPYFIEAVDGD